MEVSIWIECTESSIYVSLYTTYKTSVVYVDKDITLKATEVKYYVKEQRTRQWCKYERNNKSMISKTISIV